LGLEYNSREKLVGETNASQSLAAGVKKTGKVPHLISGNNIQEVRMSFGRLLQGLSQDLC